MDKNKSFEKLCSNQIFLQKVFLQKNEDDVKKLFAENGVEINQQQLNDIKEIIHLILGKKQKLSADEIEKVAGGIPPAAILQLSAAFTEAVSILLRMDVEGLDPTLTITALRALDENPGDPRNLSWKRVAINATNGILDLDPRIREAANGIIAWWNR